MTAKVIIDTSIHRLPLLFVGAWLAALAGAFEAMGLGPSYPEISHRFGRGFDVSVYSTAFMVPSFLVSVVVAKFLNRLSALPIFLAANIIQTIGLLICRNAPTNEMFILGRAIQGSGEGVITVCIFYCFSTFIPDSQRRSAAYTSFSVAWLAASLLSPVMYAILPNPIWISIFDILIAISIISSILLVASAPSASINWRAIALERNQKIPPFALARLFIVSIVIFTYSQCAGNMSHWALPIILGTLLVLGAVWSLLRGAMILEIGRNTAPLLVVRGTVSSVYVCAMAFIPAILLKTSGEEEWVVAAISAIGSVGWTCGAILQGRIKSRYRAQLGGSLLLLSFCCLLQSYGLYSGLYPFIFSAAFFSGLSIGIANNALPNFITESIGDNPLSDSLSGLETVDTVCTTVALTIVGYLVNLSLIDSNPATNVAIIYIILSVASIVGVVYVRRAQIV